MPPNWNDVHVKSASEQQIAISNTRAQKTYRSLASKRAQRQYADGECLFLSVMYGGFAGCLDCAGLRSGKILRIRMVMDVE